MSAVEAVEPNSTPPAGTAPEVILHGLYERHWDRIFGFCLRRLRTRQEAEDAVQNTFLNAFRAVQRGVVPLSEKAWLFKIAENVCLAEHRLSGRRRAHEAQDPELVNGVAAPEGDVETSRDLELALAALPESQRQALLLREWRGLSYREIAVQLGTSVAAVETLIFRARRGVARALSTETGVRGRVAGVFNTGSLLSALKGAFGGASVAKIATAAAVVTIVALPAGDSARGSSRAASSAGSGSVAVQASADVSAGAPRVAAWRASSGTERPVASVPGASERVAAPDAGPAKHPAVPGDVDSAEGVAQAPPPETPAAGGGATAPPAIPVTPPAPPETPVAVDPPDPPAVEIPQIPGIPPLPPVPQLPQVPQVPQAPQIPELPVQLPGLEEQLPQLPILP